MTASRHLVEGNWHVSNDLSKARESIQYEKHHFTQKSNDRLPKISSGRLASPQPRRKLAVVDNVHHKNTEKAKNCEDLPNIKTDQGTIEHHESKKKKIRNLSTSKSPNLPRSSPVGFSKPKEETKLAPSKSPEDRRTRSRHESLQPLSPRQYNLLQVSPLPRRKFRSTVERNPQTSNRNAFKQSKSISLEDIFLSDHIGSEDRSDGVKDYSQDTGGAWSQHWYYTRQSIGAKPDQDQIIAFANSPKLSYHGPASPRSIDNDIDETDSLFSKFMNDDPISQLSLEERLNHIEQQQGLSNE